MTYTITVKRAGRDRFGNPLPPTTRTVDSCQTFPAGSFSESHGLEATVEWDLDLFAPHRPDIEAQDTIKLPGDPTTYQVHGKPQHWSADGWEPGTVIKLKAVEG